MTCVFFNDSYGSFWSPDVGKCDTKSQVTATIRVQYATSPVIGKQVAVLNCDSIIKSGCSINNDAVNDIITVTVRCTPACVV